jgi:hypothetical protein
MLVTIGVLGLLATWNFASFHRTWPVILIVLGAVKVLQSSVSTEGHRMPGYVAPGSIPPVPPPPSAPSVPSTPSTPYSGGNNG